MARYDVSEPAARTVDTSQRMPALDASAFGGGNSGPGIGGSGFSVGRVGMPIALPGFQTAGTGRGVTFSTPIGAGSTNSTMPSGQGVADLRVKGGGGKEQLKAKGGKVKKMAKGGKVSSASKRADGCATKGKTKGRFV